MEDIVVADHGGGQSASSYITSAMGLTWIWSTSPFWVSNIQIQSGDPLIPAAKWLRGIRWLISADEEQQLFGVSDSSVDRVDVEDLDYETNEWWFVAMVYEPLTVQYCMENIKGLVG